MLTTGAANQLQTYDHRFATHTNEQLDEDIRYCINEIYTMVQHRDFEDIETWGKTLIDLEVEKEIRSVQKQ